MSMSSSSPYADSPQANSSRVPPPLSATTEEHRKAVGSGKNAALVDFFQYSPVGCMLLDHDGHILDFNPGAAKLIALSSKSTDVFFEEFFFEEDRPTLIKLQEQIVQSGEAQSGEVRLRKNATDFFWAQISCSALPGAANTQPQWLVAISDISERKNQQQVLQESEEKYRLFIQHANEAIYVVQDEKFVFVNNQLIRFLGLDESGIIGQSIYRFLPKETHENVRKHRDSIMVNHRGERFEVQVMAADGTYLWVSINSVAIEWKGRPATLNFTTNITKGKQVELELRENESQYRTLVDNAQEAIFVAQDGYIKFLNRHAIALGGYSEEEVLSRPFEEFIHPQDRLYVMENHYKRIAGQIEGSRYDFRVRRKNGEERWVEVSAVVIDWQGKRGTLNFLTDITERKRAEEAVRVSEEKFRNLAYLLPAMVYEMDLTGKLIYVNEYAYTMTGYSHEDLLRGFSGIQLLVAEDQSRAVAQINELLLGEGRSQNEYRAQTKDGRIIPVLATSVPILRDGKAVGLRGVFFDLTQQKQAESERRELEDQLRQSQKLEAVGLLASGIAHDFNNLLAAIMGNAELAQLHAQTESLVRKYTQNINTACSRAADLTHQLLNFARKAPAKRENTDVNAVIRQMAEIMRHTIDRRIDIITNLKPIPLMISADQSQLLNAFLNIAINARDAMPQGGILRIGAETTKLPDTLRSPDRPLDAGQLFVLVNIADNGHGMSKEIQERIFEPFFTTKEVGKGTGLGLATVYGCITQHDGYIAVDSAQGEGTQFDLYFPASIDPVLTNAESETSYSLPPNQMFLVVDDELTSLELISEILHTFGHTVYPFTSSVDAIACYETHHAEISAVILDKIMPQINGLDCLRSLKKINPDVKTIMVSGYGENDEHCLMQKEGVQAFIQKPFSIEELLGALAKLISLP